MKKKNLLFMGLVALCMSLAFVSCGDDEENTNAGGSNGGNGSRDHGAMTFVGTSTFYVVGQPETSTTTADDKVTLTLTGDGNKQAEIVIPDMHYSESMTVKSFTVNSGVEYTMTGSYATGDMAFEWADGEFTTTTTGTDGATKTVTGTVSAKYNHNAKKLDVTVEFKYGSMPMSIHYEITDAEYQKN